MPRCLLRQKYKIKRMNAASVYTLTFTENYLANCRLFKRMDL